MARKTRGEGNPSKGYDGHLGTEWPEWARWVYHLDAEHRARFRAEFERLLPDKPEVIELLCREPCWRQQWVKELTPEEERAGLESTPEADDEDFPACTWRLSSCPDARADKSGARHSAGMAKPERRAGVFVRPAPRQGLTPTRARR